jgi:MFS family permease
MNAMRVVFDKQGDYVPCEKGGDSAEPTESKTGHRNVSMLWLLMSGAGFLADAYDLFVINIAVDIMARCSHEQPLTIPMISTVKSMAVAGAIVGQIAFGNLADIIGRRRIFIITCYLVIAGSVLSGLAVDSRIFGIYSQIATWRFVLGVGIGGEYPLSAAITAESSHHGSEIRNLAMVHCAPVTFLFTSDPVTLPVIAGVQHARAGHTSVRCGPCCVDTQPGRKLRCTVAPSSALWGVSDGRSVFPQV